MKNALFIAGLVLVGGMILAGYLGVGEPRGESTYTGYVVDVEHDRGYIFRTSQLMIKTDTESSIAETFCLNSEQDVENAKTYLEDQEKIQVEYSRPLWVNPFQCQSGLSIVNNMELATNSTA